LFEEGEKVSGEGGIVDERIEARKSAGHQENPRPRNTKEQISEKAERRQRQGV